METRLCSRAAILAAFVLSEVSVEVVEKPALGESARALAEGLVEGYPVADEIRARDAARLPVAVDWIARAFRSAYGEPVRARIAALVAEASA